MYLSGKVEVQIYNDSAQTDFPSVLVPKITREFSDNSSAEAQLTVISLAASGSQTIQLNGVDTVTRMYLYSSSADIQVNINSLGNINMKYGEPCFAPFTVSSLTITNTSSTVATTVEVLLIKD